MKKVVLIVLGVLLAAFGVIAAIAPTEFTLERDIIVERPVAAVFGQIKLLKNHDQWNAWAKLDPAAKREHRGTDGQVGFIASWDSENQDLGTAEQEIKGITENQRLDTEIRFKKPFEMSFMTYTTTEAVDANRTKVVTGMHSKVPFPISVISYIFNVCFDQQQKTIQMMDETNAALKAFLEK